MATDVTPTTIPTSHQFDLLKMLETIDWKQQTHRSQLLQDLLSVQSLSISGPGTVQSLSISGP